MRSVSSISGTILEDSNFVDKSSKFARKRVFCHFQARVWRFWGEIWHPPFIRWLLLTKSAFSEISGCVRPKTTIVENNNFVGKMLAECPKWRKIAFSSIFKRLYLGFGVRYDLPRLSDDFYWPNPHFLKFWGAYTQKAQKSIFSSACMWAPSGRTDVKIWKKFAPSDIWLQLWW